MQVITSDASIFLCRFVWGFVTNTHTNIHFSEDFVNVHVHAHCVITHNQRICQKPPEECLLLRRVTVPMFPEKMRFICAFVTNAHTNRTFSGNIGIVTLRNNKHSKKTIQRDWFEVQGVESLNRLFGFSDSESGIWKLVPAGLSLKSINSTCAQSLMAWRCKDFRFALTPAAD